MCQNISNQIYLLSSFYVLHFPRFTFFFYVEQEINNQNNYLLERLWSSASKIWTLDFLSLKDLKLLRHIWDISPGLILEEFNSWENF